MHRLINRDGGLAMSRGILGRLADSCGGGVLGQRSTVGRALETNFFVPILRGDALLTDAGWMQRIAQDYRVPRHRISYASAVGRRLRRNYGWIFAIQALAYYGKLAIHPTAMTSMADLWERAAIGPISGKLVVAAGVIFHGGWVGIG